jgi:hypothetical protein
MRDNYPPGVSFLPEDIKHPCPNCGVHMHQDDLHKCTQCGEFLVCPHCDYCNNCGEVVDMNEEEEE